MKYAVIDTQVYVVEADDEAQAIAEMEGRQDRQQPAIHTTTAQPLVRKAPERPALRVVR